METKLRDNRQIKSYQFQETTKNNTFMVALGLFGAMLLIILIVSIGIAFLYGVIQLLKFI